MAEIASATGVSRQTLYDRFQDKDGIMAAAIDFIAERVCTELRAAFARETDLATNLDTYFRVAIWPTYEIMQAMPDAADFEKGLGSASIAASRRVGEAKQAILVQLLLSHMPPSGPTPHQVSRFFEQSSCQAKMSGMARDDLEQFLSVLKASVLALASKA
ncbi:DNA-binding HTH domain, TetR-type [Rhabdaerophilaceae bacterium]